MNGKVEFKSPGNVTPEGAALVLFQIIASIEGKGFDPMDDTDREWVLSTYKACLVAVQNP